MWSQRLFNRVFNITVVGMEIEEIFKYLSNFKYFLKTAHRLLTAPRVKIQHITTVTQLFVYHPQDTISQDIRLPWSECLLHMPLIGVFFP